MADKMSPETPITPSFDIIRARVLDGVPHGFFGSAGESHQFGYGGPGDPEDVRMLRAAAADAIVPGAPLQAPHQVHSPEVVTIGKVWPDAPEGRPVADALVTARTDIVLGIVTADCAPVLLADRESGVVGAAHAGWRGAVGDESNDVLTNTVTAMEALGAHRAHIAAAIGPTIAQDSYEVDAAFRENFSPCDESHFVKAPIRDGMERWQFDLTGYITAKLLAIGVETVEDIGADTYANPKKYHSYRRAVQNSSANYGRQISMIANF